MGMQQDKDKKPDKAPGKLKEWQKHQAEAYRTYLRTSAVGLEFGLSIVVGALLGYFADKYFDSAPWGLLIGVIIGSIAAGKRLYIFAKKYLNKTDSNDKND